jgi:hypothetical protein
MFDRDGGRHDGHRAKVHDPDDQDRHQRKGVRSLFRAEPNGVGNA